MVVIILPHFLSVPPFLGRLRLLTRAPPSLWAEHLPASDHLHSVLAVDCAGDPQPL
jgi:hypothetical protein